jgi:hypothetical protein
MEIVSQQPKLWFNFLLHACEELDLLLYIDVSLGGLDAGVAPEICAGGGAAGYRQGRAVPHPGDHGNRVPHSP